MVARHVRCPPTRRLVHALCLLGGLVSGGVTWAEDPPAAGRTGVELVGRTADERTLERWTLVDEATQREVVEIRGKWGFAALPAGRYALSVLPRGSGALAVSWGSVTVEEGRTARVVLDSGVELLGRSEADKPLEHWDVIEKATGELAAHTSRPSATSRRARASGAWSS
jgi:hypothetical protein